MRMSRKHKACMHNAFKWPYRKAWLRRLTKKHYLWCSWTMSLDSKHTEARFSPNSTDSSYVATSPSFQSSKRLVTHWLSLHFHLAILCSRMWRLRLVYLIFNTSNVQSMLLLCSMTINNVTPFPPVYTCIKRVYYSIISHTYVLLMEL